MSPGRHSNTGYFLLEEKQLLSHPGKVIQYFKWYNPSHPDFYLKESSLSPLMITGSHVVNLLILPKVISMTTKLGGGWMKRKEQISDQWKQRHSPLGCWWDRCQFCPQCFGKIQEAKYHWEDEHTVHSPSRLRLGRGLFCMQMDILWGRGVKRPVPRETDDCKRQQIRSEQTRIGCVQ